MDEHIDPKTDPICEVIPMGPLDEKRQGSVKGAVVVLVLMFAWLLVLYLLVAIVARDDTNMEAPISLGRGVMLTPADGWHAADEEWEIDRSGFAIQKSGVYVVFWVDQFTGTNEELLDLWLGLLRPSFESFRALPASEVTIAGDIPGLQVYFSGISEWGAEEDQLVVMSHGGLSVVMLVEAQQGQLRWAQTDVSLMLRTLEISR